MSESEKNLIEDIDVMCVEFDYKGMNATDAINANNETEMWNVAEFYGLDDESLVNDTFEMFKRIANEKPQSCGDSQTK